MPTRKVGSSAIGGALATIVIWAVNAYSGVEMPPEIAASITTIIMALIAYFVPDASTGYNEPDERYR